MDLQQNKLYRNSKWYCFREKVLKRDSYECARCGKTQKEKDLQVHHLHYIKGRKPWDYPIQELITLCKGCHAKEHGHIMPTAGWEYIGEDDLGDLIGSCDYCGSSLRYAHSIFHAKWGYIEVGCLCADKLTNTIEASEYEEKRRKLATRLRRFLDSPRWRIHDNLNFIELDGYKIKIWDNGSYFKIQIFHKGYPINSNRKYRTLEEAQSQAFEAVATGKMDEWLRNHPGYK